MKVANISTTKNNLSALLEEVRRGETVVIVDHKRPIARIDRIEEGWSGGMIAQRIQEGVLVPSVRPADIPAFLRLPRTVAPLANLNQAVVDDREGR